MAITYATATRNSQADDIDELCNAGSTNASARLVIMTSSDVEVATLVLSNPAFGAASSGTITANSITDDSNATGGTAALFKVVDRDENEVFRGTVSESGGGGDLIISTTNVSSGGTVTVSSLSYTAPS